VAAKRYTPPQILRVQKSAQKISCLNFWDHVVILHIDFISNGQTINAEYYSSLLVQLKNSLKENLHVKFSKVNLVLARQSKVHRAIAKHK